MTDSHAHLYWKSFQEDFDPMIQRAADNGLTHIINIGVDLETSQKALEQYNNQAIKIYSTIGIHPGDYLDSPLTYNDESIHKIIEELGLLKIENMNKVVAIGECGLDYFSPDSPLSDQIVSQQHHLFKLQVELAQKLQLPLVIHCRNAWNDIFNFLSNSSTGVFHCWSGSFEDAQKALDLGFYISFAGNITYKKADHLRQVAQKIPLDKILIETDSPFLSPEGKRGQRNEPANVAEVAKTIAMVRGISIKEVEEQTDQNCKKLFSLD